MKSLGKYALISHINRIVQNPVMVYHSLNHFDQICNSLLAKPDNPPCKHISGNIIVRGT